MTIVEGGERFQGSRGDVQGSRGGGIVKIVDFEDSAPCRGTACGATRTVSEAGAVLVHVAG